MLQRDIYNPKGIAVDWSTNNIYFSHTLSDSEESGRIEVVSSNGQNKHMLFYGFVSSQIAPSTGALVVNVLLGECSENGYREGKRGWVIYGGMGLVLFF